MSVIAVPAAADDDGRIAIDRRLSPRESSADAASAHGVAGETGEHKDDFAFTQCGNSTVCWHTARMRSR
jgi:hypothetical protein